MNGGISMSPQDSNPDLVGLGGSAAAKELYVDLLRPAATELGKNLLTVTELVTIAFGPLRALVAGLKQVEIWLGEALQQRLGSVAPEELQTPASFIAGQVLLQLPFCVGAEQLRDMYANLLASAMKVSVAHDVHPAFVQVIQQLTPDEALVLQKIRRDGRFVLQEELDQHGRCAGDAASLASQFRLYCVAAKAVVVDQSDAYLENLLRLRILSETHWHEGKLVSPTGFWDRREDPYVRNVSSRVIEVTSFGTRFLATCVV